MFILVMQFFWKYIDDLMGKGLSVTVILELLFYVSASLIPLALPLAILLSSIMTLGNLSENNELTALKSSGLSLYRILRPLTFIILIIATCTFFFANYVIPVANLKWHSLIFDIQNTKIATILTPGAYSTELDGYAIKVDEGEGNYFKGILIHDHTSPKEIKTIRAKEGKIYKSDNGKNLFFELKNGTSMEELTPGKPLYIDHKIVYNENNTRAARRSEFKHATYKIDLTGFDLNRSQEEMFKDKYEMFNVFQIHYAIDSVQNNGREIQSNFLLSVKNDHPYFQSLSFSSHNKEKEQDEVKMNPIDTCIVYDNLSLDEKRSAIATAQSKLRNREKNLQSQFTYMTSMNRDVDRYLIEFHRKFALTVAIIILFFIGAPLGAIVRKGGFGAPVVIAALLFMIYFVLITIGENLSNADTVSPFVGMWFASLVLLPIAIWLMISAANDRPVFRLFKFNRKRK